MSPPGSLFEDQLLRLIGDRIGGDPHFRFQLPQLDLATFVLRFELHDDSLNLLTDHVVGNREEVAQPGPGLFFGRCVAKAVRAEPHAKATTERFGFFVDGVQAVGVVLLESLGVDAAIVSRRVDGSGVERVDIQFQSVLVMAFLLSSMTHLTIWLAGF